MDLCEYVFKGVVALIVALLVAQFGLTIYFRQKEHELVQKRYLEGCIDVLAGELEIAFGAFRHNWIRKTELVNINRQNT